VGLFCSSVDHQ